MICPKCKRDLPLSEFYKRNTRKAGYCFDSCKDCKKKYNRKYWLENTETVKAQHHSYNMQHKTEHYESSLRYYLRKGREKQRMTVIGWHYGKSWTRISGIKKRPYPTNGACELCGRTLNNIGKLILLGYHHWGEVVKGQSVKGIWVCRSSYCHAIIEDPQKTRQILTKFQQLKAVIDQQTANEQKKPGIYQTLM